MRNAEARITLGVICAREGELELALDYGRQAIAGERLSVPSLLMVERVYGLAIYNGFCLN